MTRNPKPCLYCKRRRRKCTFITTNVKECHLCVQLQVPCIPSETDEEGRPVRDGNQELQQVRQQISQIDRDLQTMEQFISDSNEARQVEWKLRVVNGRIYLVSRIKNLEELLMYNQASIRYLSPFQQLFSRESIQFKGTTPSIAVASTALIIRNANPSNKPNRTDPTPRGRPDSFYKQYMDELITLYMERYNPFVGLLHAPSFLQHYQSLKDPLSSPIVLAACVDTIAYFFSRLKYSSEEKRHLAEFFYVRCRDMLIGEMFDDPRQRLQAIIASNLLMQYLLDLLLEFGEARRLLTVAYLACHEVNVDDLSTVEYALFQRHRATVQIYFTQVNMAFHDKFDLGIVEWDNVYPMDDDPPAVHSYLAMWKCILELGSSPYIVSILETLSDAIIHGRKCELSLDNILRYEPTMRSWWKNIPEEFRLCEEPFDLTSAKEALERVTSSTQMGPFAFLHAFTAIVQSVLLKPQLAQDTGEPINDDIVNIIKEKAMSLTLCSTQLLVQMMKKNLEVDIEAVPLSFGFMISVLHSVCNIVMTYHQVNLSPATERTLMHCFFQLSSIVPLDHHIPRSISSLESFMLTLKSNPLSMYEKYPMPRLAMLSDILYTCFGQLNVI